MKIKVGSSSCLMGKNVRFDSGHKYSKMCSQNLARYFEFISECPEVGIGMSELGKVSSRKTHTNVLVYIQGYLKSMLSNIEKHELSKLIWYRLAQIPLIVPITLSKHHFNNPPSLPYMAKQVYLEPYPDDLRLRNAI